MYIDNTLAVDVTVNSVQNYLYKFSFSNPITSVSATDLIVDIEASDQKIYDAEGELFYEKTINGQISKRKIGTVDYKTGDIVFELNSIQNATITFNAIAGKRNIYSVLNNIVTIDKVSITEVQE